MIPDAAGVQHAPERRVPVNKLALKIAVSVTGAALGVALLAGVLAASAAGWFLASAALVLGGVAYAVTVRLLAARLDLARDTLRHIRKHQFDKLEAAHLPRGDEVNDLIWEVYRTGLVHEKEIRELQRLENYRREFLGNVSHELKTPIFSIRGFAETLLQGALEDERVNRSFVEKIMRNADRLGNLVNDLSEVARIEMGELEMTMDAFDLHQLVGEVVESLEPLAIDKAITIHYQIPDAVPDVAGDRERIRQVLINLVDNAIKYNNPGGRVEVMARLLSSGHVKVSVVDNGIGVAPQHIDRLTERFYRVDTSRSRSQGGTGLGLAIVKHILGAHDSRLMVESQPGRGSTFGFLLPTADEEHRAVANEGRWAADE